MADGDHQKIIETVLGLVRKQLRESGALGFTVLTLYEQGREGRIDIDPEFFRSDATKNRLKRDLRRDFRQKGIVRYALAPNAGPPRGGARSARMDSSAKRW